MSNFFQIFKNKKILVTGHTGFKGSWLSIWLHHIGAQVVGVSLDPPSNPNNYTISKLYNKIEDHRIDILNKKELSDLINTIKPDYIFHLAAKAIVRESFEQPLETILTNTVGTINILEILRHYNQRVVTVLITSDKVYENFEIKRGYHEDDIIGGKDPYSASKGMTEIAIKSYINSYFPKSKSKIRIAVARAGNVIGGGDWADSRVVADCMRAWSKNEEVKVRYPLSTRPWQHVLEPLSGYLNLAYNLNETDINHGEAFNFGPAEQTDYTVRDLIHEISKHWSKVKWKDVSNLNSESLNEAKLLKLNCDKAYKKLSWFSALSFEETIKFTVDWYKFFYSDHESNMFLKTIEQIKDYSKIAKNKKLDWAINN